MTLVAKLRARGHPPILAATLIGAALVLLAGGMYVLIG